ncbi:hypothetical protein MJO29_010931 [Puccinia striiformis f. sp. tritici]|nr:hypothetical protein MJO29_010931 [Puccinia striiformis f. sp. tritici]
MTTTRTPNHPAIVSGLFEAIEESSAPTTRGNQYGLVHTSSFLQCGGIKKDKLENFQIHLQTNTALTNILLPHTLYYLSGRMIALNDGTTPNLTYNHDTLAAVEVASDDTESGNTLEVTVTHHDWDSEARCHRKFNIKYIIPGTRYFIKTHPIYQIGREVHIVGQIVDFEMESHLAVVLVTSVSLTSGHQAAKASANHTAGGTPSTSGGRQFTTFAGPVPPTTPSLPPGKTSFSNHALASSTKKKSKKAKNSTPSPSETIVSNKKGKSKAIQEDISHSEGSSSDSDSDESDEESTPPQSSPAERGRPRRDAVKQAAKSMAKK